MAQSELIVWKARWDALNEAINELIGHFRPRAPADHYRKAILRTLIQQLKTFAGDQFGFFYDGFGAHDRFILEPSQEYSIEYAFHATLSQVATDLEMFERAADQFTSGTPKSKETLVKADKLAWKALQPAMASGLIEKTTALAYFQKLTAVRVIPYAPVALIGVPYTCRSVARDYLSIPHEVGHYVFRHGMAANERILTMVQNGFARASLPSWCCRWQEEILADVYGGIIGGPVMALDFQDLQLECCANRFIADDGVHPVPALRPAIYTRVLEKMGLSISAAKLRDRWNDKLAQRHAPELYTLGTETVALDDAQQTLFRAVDLLFDRLSGIQAGCWFDDVDPQYAIDNLYHDLDIATLVTGVNEADLEAIDLEPDARPWIALIKAPLVQPSQRPKYVVTPEAWLHVLLADGWATKGPQAEWHR